MVLRPQTHEKICTRGLTPFITHSKKGGVLGMLDPLDFLLSIKQSLSCAWVLGLNAWKKQTL